MNIAVEYKNNAGNISNCSYALTRLAFVKHMAIAGQRYAPTPQKLIRTIAMFFYYSFYLQRQDFYNNKFSVPPTKLYDPTEKVNFQISLEKQLLIFYQNELMEAFIL